MFRKSAAPTEAWQRNPLAARLSVPVDGAWDRLYAGKKRAEMLRAAFSAEAMGAGTVFAVVGPRGAGKSAVALAVCDLRGLTAVYATVQAERPALAPASDQCLIVDPVSAFQPDAVRELIAAYRGVSPIILADRTVRAFRGVFEQELSEAAANNDVTMLTLKLPSSGVIAQYVDQLLSGYDTTLHVEDYRELGQTMEAMGMSLPHVNQVAVGAALSRLQHADAIDRASFDEALTDWKRLRGSEEYA